MVKSTIVGITPASHAALHIHGASDPLSGDVRSTYVYPHKSEHLVGGSDPVDNMVVDRDAASGILPTTTGAYDIAPAPLANLTDGSLATHLTTPGQDNDAGYCGIQINLGAAYFIRRIVISNPVGGGYCLNSGASINMLLKVDGVTVDTQALVADAAYHDSTLVYELTDPMLSGQVIQIGTTGTGTPNTYFIDLSLIEVFVL